MFHHVVYAYERRSCRPHAMRVMRGDDTFSAQEALLQSCEGHMREGPAIFETAIVVSKSGECYRRCPQQ